MKTSSFIPAVLLLLFAIAAMPGFGVAEAPAAEKAKIEALIISIENLKSANFVRNGKEYDAKTAGKFLRGKWKAQDKEVTSAVDFIDKVASASGTSGKAYVIRFKDGREVRCGDYLKGELKKL